MRNNAKVKMHNVYSSDDYMVPKAYRALVWKATKKKTKCNGVTKRRKK